MDLSKATWRKSSLSTGNGGNCVEEVADNLAELVAVRDSKDLAGPVLTFPAGQWASFVAGVRTGEVGR